MHCIDFSHRKVNSLKLCFSPYGSEMKMNIWLLGAFFLIFTCSFVNCEYPGRRYQILSKNQHDRQHSNEKLDLERVADEYVRLRYQKELLQKHQSHQPHHHQRPPINYPQEIVGPGFSFLYPINTKNNEYQPQNPNEPLEFAVQPFDSRYFEPSVDASEDIEVNNAGGYDSADEGNTYFNSPNGVKNDVFTSNNNNDDSEIPSDSISLIPPPMHVLESKQQTDRILHRNQMKTKNVQQQQEDVMQKPMQVDFDNTMSLYIVALIAGLSCAFSTGLIALGLMYWTLYKKSKSADACDFACDYGVIGPRAKNLENSQNAIGDKKLAHSAQMFHYQHQKQQIIAMENRNAEMSHNNDDENDSDDNENDFTVYECPGLAEWDSGMEVKNPLFTEETPAATVKNEKAQSTKASK